MPKESIKIPFKAIAKRFSNYVVLLMSLACFWNKSQILEHIMTNGTVKTRTDSTTAMPKLWSLS
jgi:hypothetical protein